MHLDRAAAFVAARGDHVEQARLRFIQHGERPAQSILEMLMAGQNRDGGFPAFWSGGQSSLDATCYRLAQAEQLGLGASIPALANALDFLAVRMQADGSWQEAAELAIMAPPWAMPGERAASIYLTANCAYWLSAYPNKQEIAAKASIYLAGHIDADGRLPSFLHAHWLAGGLWCRTGLREQAEAMMAYLYSRLGDIQAGGLAWMISALRIAGVLSEHAILRDACQLLAGRQEQDGRWASEDGPERDVSATLEAMRALLLCGSSEVTEVAAQDL